LELAQQLIIGDVKNLRSEHGTIIVDVLNDELVVAAQANT